MRRHWRIRNWTEEDEAMLRYWYGNHEITTREIAEKLLRSECSVSCKAYKMGLHKMDAFRKAMEEGREE